MSYFRIGGSSGGGLIDNISANKVIETSTRVFVTPQEKAQITDNKQRIETLEQSGGGIDLTQIVDGVTIDLVGDKLVVKNVDGLTIGIVDINTWLVGTERNIQDQIDDINTSLVALTSGMRFRGKVATRADLSTVTSTKNGDLVVVLSDEQQNDGRSLYVFSDDLNEWDFIGEFIFSDKFIELQDTPNNYTGHDGKIVRVDETNEKLVFDVIQWSEIEGKPNSTPTQIDNAASKAHEHTNKSVLDKFSEDAEGKPLYDGKSIGNGESADLSELEQKVNNNATDITNLQDDFDRHLAEKATTTQLGHVKIGQGVSVNDGVISSNMLTAGGQVTRDATLTGLQTINLPFTPKEIIIFATDASKSGLGSFGIVNPQYSASMYFNHNRTANQLALGEVIIIAYGVDDVLSGLVRIAENSFTIDWTKTGSTTGTVYIRYWAKR